MQINVADSERMNMINRIWSEQVTDDGAKTAYNAELVELEYYLKVFDLVRKNNRTGK